MVSILWHYSDLSRQKITIVVTSGSEEVLLSMVRPMCGMGVLSSEALDISGSPYLTIDYLLTYEQEDLESKFCGWLVKIRGWRSQMCMSCIGLMLVMFANVWWSGYHTKTSFREEIYRALARIATFMPNLGVCIYIYIGNF